MRTDLIAKIFCINGNVGNPYRIQSTLVDLAKPKPEVAVYSYTKAKPRQTMSNHTVRIQSIKPVTHNVLQFVTSKPDHFEFKPGQATEVSINKEGWSDELRPFTFTSLPKEDVLQFTIKTYPERAGVTDELRELQPGDEFILHDVFGAIQYKGEGVFIAGGAGVTPFIAIFRDLKDKGKIGNNRLIFSNKTSEDIILKEEFRNMLGENFVNILSEEKTDSYPNGHVSKDFLKSQVSDFDQKFYVCGPDPMIDNVVEQLKELGVSDEDIVVEE